MAAGTPDSLPESIYSDYTHSSSTNQLTLSDSSSSGKKRTRASKPKVRTGCITCKIRRVKCDEIKPSCVRCTSTGRKCDGYAEPAPPRRKASPLPSEDPSPLKIHPQQQHQRVRSPRPVAPQSTRQGAAPGGKPSLRNLAPSTAIKDNGAGRGKADVRRFRRVAATTGLAFDAWNSDTELSHGLVLQISHKDDAVKHGLIALGTSYQAMKMRQRMQAGPETTIDMVGCVPESEYSPSELELFTIQHYNQSIRYLQRHIESSTPESTEITLLCCLIFICLESSRKDQDMVLSHVANGLSIIDTLPAEANQNPFDSDGYADRRAATQGSSHNSPRISKSEWAQLLGLFAGLELCAMAWDFEGGGPAPVVSIELRRQCVSEKTYDQPLPEFTSAADVHRHQMCWAANVYTRMFEVAPHRGDTAWWSNPTHGRLHHQLLSRGLELQHRTERYLTGPHAPCEGTPEHYVALVARLCTRGLLPIVETMPQAHSRPELAALYPTLHHDIISLAEAISLYVIAGGARGLGSSTTAEDLTLDNGVLVIMHVLISSTLDPEIRRRARDVIRVFSQKRDRSSATISICTPTPTATTAPLSASASAPFPPAFITSSSINTAPNTNNLIPPLPYYGGGGGDDSASSSPSSASPSMLRVLDGYGVEIDQDNDAEYEWWTSSSSAATAAAATGTGTTTGGPGSSVMEDDAIWLEREDYLSGLTAADYGFLGNMVQN